MGVIRRWGDESAPGTWRTALDRALLVAVCAVVLTKMLVPVSALGVVGASPFASGLGLALLTVLASSAVLIGCCLWGIARGVASVPGWLPLTTALCGVAAAAVAVIAGAEQLTVAQEQLLPMNAVSELQWTVVLFVVTTTRVYGVLLATAPAYVLLRTGSLDGVAWSAAEEWLIASSGAFAIAVLVPYLRASADVSDGYAAAARTATGERAQREAQEIAEEEAHRVVHDDVLSALRGIQMSAPRTSVVAACEAAIQSLHESATAMSAGEISAALTSAAPVEVTVEGDGWVSALPPRVASAFLGAAGEALRNVARHSGTDRAVVRFDEVDGTISLEVEDAGVGFGGVAPGFGIRSSIVGRLREAGGDAELRSSGSGGALVCLRWALPVPPRASDLGSTPLIDSGRRRTYLLVALPLLVANGVTAAGHGREHPFLTFLVAAAAGTLLMTAAWRLGRREPGVWELVGYAVGVSAVTAAGLSITGEGALMTLESWVVGFGGVTTALIAFVVRPLLVAPMVAAQVAVVVAFAVLDPTIQPWAPIGALIVVPLNAGFVAIVGAALRASRRPIAAHAAVIDAEVEQRAWAEHFAQARAVHLRAIGQRVVPVLRQAIADPDDPALPALAERLAGECRDDLYFDAPLSTDLHRLLTEARQRGVTINIRTDGVRLEREPTARLLRALMRSVEGASHITVYPGDEASAVRAVVRPGPGPGARDLLVAELGAGATVTGTTERAEVRMPPARGSSSVAAATAGDGRL